MFELVLFVCLVREPHTCERVRLPFQEPMGVMSCMRAGQLRAAEWQASHPAFTVKKWRCDQPKV